MALATAEFLLRLLVALLLGFIIGLEREFRSDTPRAAGMRTLALVALGSALFTLISAYGFLSFTSSIYARTDPSRIAAQIVTGIGFLGAGAILLRKQAVRGLTTAAAVWATAAIGMAVALGLYVESIGATVLALAVLEALRPLERIFFPRQTHSRIQLRINRDAEEALGAIQAACHELNLTPRKLVVQESARMMQVTLEFTHQPSGELLPLVQRLRVLPAVSALRTELINPRSVVKRPGRSR
jgi:putative Mg2+ transporter-C (MgtC) family protein